MYTLRILVNLLLTFFIFTLASPAYAINCTGISRNAEESWFGRLVCDPSKVWLDSLPVETVQPNLPTPTPVPCSSPDPRWYEQEVALTLANYIKIFGPLKVFNMSPPRVCVVSLEQLNDPKIFSAEPGKVVGRYQISNRLIYITPAALEPHSTDLAHELVHHFNSIAGITDARLDEQMAYAFEARYASEY